MSADRVRHAYGKINYKFDKVRETSPEIALKLFKKEVFAHKYGGDYMGDSELTDAQRSSLRYRPRKLRFPDWAGLNWNIGLTTLVDAYREAGVEKVFMDMLRETGFFSVKPDPLQYFKALSDICKTFKVGGKYWLLFVNVDLVGGHPASKGKQYIIDEAREWVEWKGDLLGGAKYESLWLKQLDKIIGGKQFFDYDVDTFVRNRTFWATPGSSADKSIIVESDDGTYYAPKTKIAWSSTLTSADIYKILFTQQKRTHAHVREVIGAGKNRTIITTDNATHIQMSYISLQLEPLFKNHPLMPQFWSKDYSLKRMCQRCSDIGGPVNVPLDQEGFDRNQRKRQILLLLRRFREMAKGPASRRILDNLLYEFDNTSVFAEGLRFNYDAGVLSGWRWTMLIDTLLSITNAMVINEIISATGYTMQSMLAQGDDLDFMIDDIDTAWEVPKLYELVGFKVNPTKFFVDRYRTEFLRKVYTRSGIYGYPARAVLSINWRKPQSTEEIAQDQRVQQSITSWKTLQQRVQPYSHRQLDFSKFTLLDVYGMFKHQTLHARDGERKVTYNDVVNMLSAPRQMGGFGIGNAGSSIIGFERIKRFASHRPTGFRNWRSDSSLSAAERLLYFTDVIGCKYIKDRTFLGEYVQRSITPRPFIRFRQGAKELNLLAAEIRGRDWNIIVDRTKVDEEHAYILTSKISDMSPTQISENELLIGQGKTFVSTWRKKMTRGAVKELQKMRVIPNDMQFNDTVSSVIIDLLTSELSAKLVHARRLTTGVLRAASMELTQQVRSVYRTLELPYISM